MTRAAAVLLAFLVLLPALCAAGAADTLVPQERRIGDREARATLAGLLADRGGVQDLARAATLLERALEQTGDDAPLLLDLARVRALQGERNRALALLDRAVSQSSGNPVLLADAADVAADLGRFGQTRERYREALALAGEDTPTGRALSLRLAGQQVRWGDFYGALARWQERLDRAPEDWDAHLGAARALAGAQRLQEAAGALQRLHAMAPEGSAAWRLAGLEAAEVLLLAKEFAATLHWLDRLDPALADEPQARLLRGRALLGQGRPDAALRAFSGVPASAATQPRRDALDGRFRALQALGRSKEAAQAAFLALEQWPESPAVQLRAHLATRSDGPESDWLDRRLEQVRQAPDAPGRLHAWGEVLARNGYFAWGRRFFRAALDTAPDHFPSRLGLAEVLAAAEEHGESLVELDSLHDTFPESYKVALTRARVLAWDRQWDAALTAYAALMRAHPRDPVAVREAARTAYWAKRARDGRRLYAAAVQPSADALLAERLAPVAAEGPESLRAAHAALARSAAQGSVHQGWEAFAAAFARFGPELPGQRRQTVARALDELGPHYRSHKAAALERTAKAWAWDGRFLHAARGLERLIDHEPGNQEARFDLGQANCALGLCDEEQAAYRELLALDSLHGLAARALERARIRSGPALGLEYSLWREQGRGEVADMARQTLEAWGEAPLGCRTRVRLIQGAAWDDPERGGPHAAHVQGLEARSQATGWLRLEGALRARDYRDASLPDAHTGRAAVGLDLDDWADLRISWQRRQEAANAFALDQGVRVDAWRAELASDLSRNVDVLVAGERQAYRDGDGGNAGRTARAALGWRLTDHPREFKVVPAVEYRDTDRESREVYDASGALADIEHPYWTPQEWWGAAVTLAWRHDLAQRFFCGAQQHYYDLRLTLGTASDDNPGATLEALYVLEFLDRWGWEVRATWHESAEWDASALSTGLRLHF